MADETLGGSPRQHRSRAFALAPEPSTILPGCSLASSLGLTHPVAFPECQKAARINPTLGITEFNPSKYRLAPRTSLPDSIFFGFSNPDLHPKPIRRGRCLRYRCETRLTVASCDGRWDLSAKVGIFLIARLRTGVPSGAETGGSQHPLHLAEHFRWFLLQNSGTLRPPS